MHAIHHRNYPSNTSDSGMDYARARAEEGSIRLPDPWETLGSVDALEAGDGIEASIEAHDRRSPQASHHGDVDGISRREFC